MAQITTNAVNFGLYATLTVTQGYQNIAENYTDLTWEVSVGSTGGGKPYTAYKENFIKAYINGELVKSGPGGKYTKGDRWSGTRRVYHNADGSKNIKLFIEARFPSYCTAEGDMWLTSIPRKATFSWTGGVIDTTDHIYFSYNNPAGNAVDSLQFTARIDDDPKKALEWRNVPKTGTEYKYILSSKDIDFLREKLGNSKSTKLVYCLKTRIGGKDNYDYRNTHFSVTKASSPTLSGSLSFEEITKNLPDNKILQNKNNLKVTFNGNATPTKGTSIKTLRLKIGNKIINNDATNKVFNVGNINANGAIRAELTAIDGRGLNSATKKLDLYIYEYKNPFVKIEATRKNNYEDETTIIISGKIYPINIKGSEFNAIKDIKYSYGGNTYNISHRSINKDGTFKIPAIYKSIPNTKSEKFKVYLKDKFSNVSNTTSINKGQPIFRISTADSKLYNNEKRVLTEDDISYELIASPNLFMGENDVVEIKKGIKSYPNGIILVWSRYKDGAPREYDFVMTYIHKSFVDLFSGKGLIEQVGRTNIGDKYFYVYNNKIVGNADNTVGESGTFVLRRVIGY